MIFDHDWRHKLVNFKLYIDMLINQHVKFYSRVLILLLLISTGILYYVANRGKTTVPVNENVYPHISDQANVNLKDNIHRLLQENKAKPSSETVRRLDFDGSVYKYGPCTEEIKIAVVLCGDRFNQTLITLKSAAVFSKAALHFIIISDEENKKNLSAKLLEWPAIILRHLSFEIHPLHFPNGTEGNEWKKLFKLCACQRLFLPSLLKHIDSILYVDTDVLFLHPAENLWNNFHKMNSSHIAALCPEHEDFATGWYNRFARHPYYEPLGVNSGVMLMNLTRMRAFHWESYLPYIMKEYKLHIVWGDQDVINIIFHFHPDKLYLFSCEWNYRPDHCMYSSVCKTAEQKGIAVIHGNRGVFQNKKQPAFKAIYKAMCEYTFGNDLNSSFYEPLKFYLKETLRTNCGKHLMSIFSTFKIPSDNVR